MGGTWPAQRIQALRINSDTVTHPSIGGVPRRVKQPLAGGRWVGLVLLFSTDTGALLAMFPDGVMQRMRVGAASGLALKHLARENASTLALIGTGWQAGAHLMAARAVRRFKEVRVFSPRAESRAAFASHAQAFLGVKRKIRFQRLSNASVVVVDRAHGVLIRTSLRGAQFSSVTQPPLAAHARRFCCSSRGRHRRRTGQVLRPVEA